MAQRKNVSISCEVTDDGARFGNDDESVKIELRTDIAEGTTTADAETGSRRVCDKAGNCATAGPAKGIKVDKENPEITINIPRSGAEYMQSHTVKADYTCTDGGSSIGMCSGPVTSGGDINTDAVGPHSFKVEATDKAGNVYSESSTYKVIYDFGGFLPPIKAPPTLIWRRSSE